MHLRRLAPLTFGAAACLTVSFGSMPDAHADEPSRLIRFEPDAYPTPATRGSVALAGAAVTAAFYAPAFGASYMWPDSPGAEDLRIPVAGP